MNKFLILVLLLSANISLAQSGTLFLAHGSMQGCGYENPTEWEKHVLDSVERVRPQVDSPIEIAFGMWNKIAFGMWNTRCFKAGLEKLEALSPTGVITELNVVPLFISSFSAVIEMQKYIFKVRDDKVIPLPMVTQIEFDGKINYQRAIDYSPTISKILDERTNELLASAASKGIDKNNVDIVLVMHGPSGDSDNELWMQMGRDYTNDLSSLGYNSQVVVSLRDDADEPIRNQATKELRGFVAASKAQGRTPAILPLLLSSGGIEAGILQRLEGLEYLWEGEALLPSSLLDDYIISRSKQ